MMVSETYSVILEEEGGFEIVGLENVTVKAAMENVREIMERQDEGLQTTGVRNPVTGARYEYDPRYGVMIWRTISGDEVNMTPLEWRDLLEEVPKVMEIFGI